MGMDGLNDTKLSLRASQTSEWLELLETLSWLALMGKLKMRKIKKELID